MMRRASVIVVFSLMTSVATAYAECAWVFWLEAGDARTHESSSRPVSGWGTREACEQALTQKLASDSEKDTDMEVTIDRQAGRPRLWLRRKGHPEPLAVYSYVCLPDTVDPRGPKGVSDSEAKMPDEVQYKGWAIESQSYESDGRRWRPKALVSAVDGGTLRMYPVSAPLAVMFDTEREADAYAVQVAKKWIDDRG